jgi:hypothetical protein
MSVRSVSAIVVLLAAGGWLLERPISASIAGTASVSVDYNGEVRSADGVEQYRFNISIEPVMFRLQTMQGKYKMVRLRISNATSTPLALSADRDRLELLTRDGASVAAVLNPQRGDTAFWDALDATTRTTLAYPTTLKGSPDRGRGGAPSSPESLYIYVLVPAAQVNDLPESFRYTIASLNQTIVIRGRPPMAA